MATRQGRGRRAGRTISFVAGALALASIPFGTARAGNGARGDGVKPNQSFTGATSQGSVCGANRDEPCTVTAQLNRKGTKVNVSWQTRSTCDNGTTAGGSSFSLKPERISSKGKVNVTFLSDVDLTQIDSGLHVTGKAKFPVRLAFKRSGSQYVIQGTISAAMDLTYDDGSTTHCSMGPATFTLLPQ